MAASAAQSKNWMFTINNPTDADRPLEWDTKYIVFQLERGESGTPHFQGYVIFLTNKRLSALKKLHSTAHWEARRGSHEQAVHYVTKPHPGCTCEHCKDNPERLEGPWTSGLPPEQGKRNDLLLVKEKIQRGAKIETLYDDHFHSMILYKKAFMEYRSSIQKPRTTKTQVCLHWGPPGVGKSTRVKNAIPSDSYWKDSANKWFDDYDFEEHVVFDEFDGNWFPYSFAKRLFDFTPVRVEFKGRSSRFTSSFIHLITNRDPTSWYEPSKHPYMEIHRRIEICYLYSSVVGEEPTVFWDHLATPPICPHPECPELQRYRKLHPDQEINPVTHISTPAGTWQVLSDDH